MSETEQQNTRPRLSLDWSASEVAGAAALGLTVLVLVAGAFLVGQGGGAFEDAGARIQALYDAGDGQGMMEAFVEGSIPPAQEEATANALRQIVRPGISVASVEEPVDVMGASIVRVTTDDGIDWCVRPDGDVLPRCRIGEVLLDATTDAPAEISIARADIPLEGPTQLTLAIESTVPQPVPLRGLHLRTEDGDELSAELVQAVNVIAGQPSPVDPENPTLAAGSTLYLVWTTEEDLSGRDLVLEWEDGRIDLDAGRARWFVG
ncbi:MAG: hypothetical protein KY457_03035 [Actinobacteria bacterium]|nr:hypothetical protein [Actinomycetota bacterium]